MSSTTTRVVHFKLDPALQAYLAHLDETGGTADLHDYDLFVAGYRSRPSTDDADHAPASAAVGSVGARSS